MVLSRLSKHREFIGHVGTIITGRSAATVVGLAVTPLVARLYSPSDFGVAASFLALAGIAAQVASLRYETAIALPKDDREAILLAALSYRILPAFCLFLYGVIAVLKLLLPTLSTFELLDVWIWLLPLTVLMMSAQDVQESWLARKKSFGIISKSVVVDTSVGGAGRLGLGVLGGSSVYGLVFGHLMGVISRLALQGRASTDSLAAALQKIEWKTLRAIAIRYSDFAKLNAPAGLLYSTSQNLPVLIFGIMFSPAVAGLFAMANRLSKIPVQIVATSVRRVFLQKAAGIHNMGRGLRRSFVLTTLGLLALGTLPFAIVLVYGQPVLTWLLGSNWFIAGRFLEIIAPWVLSAWVSAPCNPVFIVLRKQREWLVVQLATTVVRLGAFPLGYAMGFEAEGTLGLFVAASVVANLATVIIAFNLTKSSSPPGTDDTGRQNDSTDD